jgi:hypothetical protein
MMKRIWQEKVNDIITTGLKIKRVIDKDDFSGREAIETSINVKKLQRLSDELARMMEW